MNQLFHTLPQLMQALRDQDATMRAQLRAFCEINSGTHNLPGLAVMHDALHKAFSEIADDIQSIPMPVIEHIDMQGESAPQPFGHLLYIRKRPELTRRVLLSGHMDTVYGANHAFQSLRAIDENCLNGPGVADMKGGLVVMLHALAAFEKTPFAQALGWDVVINADEEVGSPASREFFQQIASQYQVALVYEPTMTADGVLAKNRKGSAKLTVVAQGKAAHAGRAFDEGRNAICYLAEVVCAIHALNGERQGVTINVGKIAGGEALNVVPDKAVAKLDVRISCPEDEAWVWQALEQVFQRLNREGYVLSLHGDFGRPVKRVDEACERLFARVQRIGQELDLSLDWKDSGGCCDGNNWASHGLAVLDTLGVRGGAIHSQEEFVLLDSLVERASLSALLLVDLAQGGLEALTQQDWIT